MPAWTSQSLRGIGLPTCVALVTSTMVGTGVYTSLGFQLQDLRSGFSILLLWVIGGIVSLCGALCYAEIAARIPRSGGEYTYLSEIYHPALGFTAGFVSLTAGFAGPIALAAMALGSYFHAAVPACPPRFAEVAAVLGLTLLHLRSLDTSRLVQNTATLVKFLLIGSFLLLGILAAVRHPGSLAVLRPSAGSLGELLRPSAGIALIFVLYAYSGWNATAYLAGEVREGRRTVGLSLILGTLAVTVLYVALNAVFLTAAPASDLKGVLNVATVAAEHLIGPSGGRVMSGVIALGLLAPLSAMIWAGPRVTQRAGEDIPVLGFLGVTSASGIPRRALLLQLALVLAFLSVSSFEVVLVLAQIPLLLCLMLGVGGTAVLRWKRGLPEEGLFRCPLHPLPALIFVLCSAAAIAYSGITRPWTALGGIAIILVPLLLYRLFLRRPR
jgi:basic amino acid/polyamine antiporter, APA family